MMCWCDDADLCCSYFFQRFVSTYKTREGTTAESPVESVQSLFPLLLETLPQEMQVGIRVVVMCYLQDSIVVTQLTNTSKFWLPYPVPSVSADAAQVRNLHHSFLSYCQFEPVFGVDLMWRGPVWPILNFFVMEGLELHGYITELSLSDCLLGCVDVADELMDRWVAMYEVSGIWEQYNPYNATNYGVEGLGMSTLIAGLRKVFFYRFNA
jgi:hypothetical protein